MIMVPHCGMNGNETIQGRIVAVLVAGEDEYELVKRL
jgi:hypothetical protein